ncbi:phage tail protein [Acinetobacter sp. CFCC 10889]|uniref:phage tail fiber protein n=1 Tax=Acinetobacter sp. CFCC 10889 TaxID=1775557 RepID=UPI000DCFE160|nr:phage tail protein [Acinetobacter sp. CFCC 10889]
MSKQTINVGSAANDGTGTPTRTAFQYVNANFTELYNAVGGSNGTIPSAIPVANGGTGATTAAAARTNLGLGSAALKNAGLSDGDVMTVGSYGLGRTTLSFGATLDEILISGFGYGGGLLFGNAAHSYISARGTRSFIVGAYGNRLAFSTRDVSGSYSQVYDCYTTANTTKDSNGFIKAASPIVQLFSEKIELNDEAKQQEIVFEKLGVGNYLVKGSSGFAQEGWYVEMPKDANGNVLVAVVYKQLENKDISVKTYKKKFDIETASIVADLTQPVDIPEGRWIDLRLQELPQEVIDEP